MNIADASAVVLNGRSASAIWLDGVLVWPVSNAPGLTVRGALAAFHNSGDNMWSAPLVDGAAAGDVAVVLVATDSTTAGFFFLAANVEYLGDYSTTEGEHVVRLALARVVLTADDVGAGMIAGTYSTWGRCIAVAAVCAGGGAALDITVGVQNTITSGAVSLMAPSAEGEAGGVALMFAALNAGGDAPSFVFDRGNALVDTSGVIPPGTAYMHAAVAALPLVESTATGDLEIAVPLSAHYWQGRGIAAQVVITR